MSALTSSIDWELCLRLSNNDPITAKELLAMLAESLPTDKTTIVNLYQAKDYGALEVRLHRLHGSLCYTGAPHLKAATKDLENLLKSKAFSQLQTAYQIFIDELDLTINALHDLAENGFLQCKMG